MKKHLFLAAATLLGFSSVFAQDSNAPKMYKMGASVTSSDDLTTGTYFIRAHANNANGDMARGEAMVYDYGNGEFVAGISQTYTFPSGFTEDLTYVWELVVSGEDGNKVFTVQNASTGAYWSVLGNNNPTAEYPAKGSIRKDTYKNVLPDNEECHKPGEYRLEAVEKDPQLTGGYYGNETDCPRFFLQLMNAQFSNNGNIAYPYIHSNTGNPNVLGYWANYDTKGTAVQFDLVKAESVVNTVDYTFNYSKFGDFKPTSVTVKAIPGTKFDATSVPTPDFFDAKEVKQGGNDNTFEVSGEWTFPFALNQVFRADLRKGATVPQNGGTCTNWTVTNNQIKTRDNANADVFSPENLFYFNGHGFNEDNRFVVTLHTIVLPDKQGYECSTDNKFSENPTKWVIKKNTNGTEGVSLQRPDNVDAHANDINGNLGVWVDSRSLNDVGSFVRFKELTDTDWNTTIWQDGNGKRYLIDADLLAKAKDNRTADNVRSVFENSNVPAIILTVELTYNGKTINTVELFGKTGQEFTLEAPAFFNDIITVTIPDKDDKITKDLTQLELPFQYTENTDNMIWLAVQQHYSYKDGKTNYTWTFSESESNTIVARQSADVATEGFSDAQLWAFVGNYNEGFKIYNKKAGTDEWLYYDGTNAKIGKGEDCLWKVFPTNNLTARPTNTYCCFKTEKSTYINLNVNLENGTQLTFWDDADEGSTIWFPSLVKATVDYIYSINALNNALPDNTVGKCKDDDTSNLVKEAEESMSKEYDANVAASLRESLKKYLESPKYELNPNCWYRLLSTEYANEYLTLGTDNNIYGGEKNFMTNHNSIVQFVPVDDKADTYYLLSQGNYFGHVKESTTVTQVTTEDSRGTFTVNGLSYAKYAITDTESSTPNRSSLHHANHNNGNNIVGWSTDAGASQWYIVPAEQVEVALNNGVVDEMNVGFGYFPFPVTTSNGSLYYVNCGTDNKTNDKVVTYTDVKTVPAHTAFMIGHAELKTATLDIDYSGIATFANADETPVNLLSGTLRAKDAEAGDYTFGVVDENKNYGFVKSADAAPAVNANSAYLPNNNLPEEFRVEESLRFNSPSQTTDIAEINAENSAAGAVYDLQGRKLVAPVKGINIVNGKKVLVK